MSFVFKEAEVYQVKIEIQVVTSYYTIRLRAGNYIGHYPGQTMQWIFTQQKFGVYIPGSAKKYFFL